MEVYKNNKKNILFFLLFLLFLLFDLYIKYRIRRDNFFPVCNTGIAFNISINYSLLMFLGWSTAICTAGCIFIFYKKKCFLSFILGIIFIGIISNLLERIAYGCIADFIHIPVYNSLYFNISDMYISLGVAALLLLWESCA